MCCLLPLVVVRSLLSVVYCVVDVLIRCSLFVVRCVMVVVCCSVVVAVGWLLFVGCLLLSVSVCD